MLTINRKSWHYRFFSGMRWLSVWRYAGDPQTLCSYFWAVLLSPLAPLITGVVLAAAIGGGGFIAGSLLVCPWVAWWMEAHGYEVFVENSQYGYIQGFAIMGWAMYIGAFIILSIILVRSLWKATHERSDTVALATEFIAAKKRGICPLLRYED